MSAILITGVSRRAGLHLAKAFLAQGQPVIGTYREPSAELDALAQAGAELHVCDFHQHDSVQALLQAVRGKHTHLRAIIHNASQWLPEREDQSDRDTIEAMMRMHVNVPYEINRQLAPLLMAAPGEHADIIHIGDYVSSRGSRKHIAYAASKAAQDNLTLSFAQLLAPRVKVNSIAPALLAFNDGDDEDYRIKAKAKSLMGREAGFDELQRTVEYLLESSYVTGRVLPLDGGRHLR